MLQVQNKLLQNDVPSGMPARKVKPARQVSRTPIPYFDLDNTIQFVLACMDTWPTFPIDIDLAIRKDPRFLHKFEIKYGIKSFKIRLYSAILFNLIDQSPNGHAYSAHSFLAKQLYSIEDSDEASTSIMKLKRELFTSIELYEKLLAALKDRKSNKNSQDITFSFFIKKVIDNSGVADKQVVNTRRLFLKSAAQAGLDIDSYKVETDKTSDWRPSSQQRSTIVNKSSLAEHPFAEKASSGRCLSAILTPYYTLDDSIKFVLLCMNNWEVFPEKLFTENVKELSKLVENNVAFSTLRVRMATAWAFGLFTKQGTTYQYSASAQALLSLSKKENLVYSPELQKLKQEMFLSVDIYRKLVEALQNGDKQASASCVADIFAELREVKPTTFERVKSVFKTSSVQAGYKLFVEEDGDSVVDGFPSRAYLTELALSLIKLLKQIPAMGCNWAEQDREQWLQDLKNNMDLIYGAKPVQALSCVDTKDEIAQ